MTFRALTVLQEKSRMRTIRAQLYTSGNEWLETTGSQPEMDRGRRGITERDRGRRRIAAGDG
jgi:hypothetical protein